MMPYDDEIELMDIFRVLWKRKVMIGALVFFGVFITLLFVQFKYPKIKRVTCQIDLSFPGISEHKNPDGTLFEKDDIILPEVIGMAYERLIKNYGNENNKIIIHDILHSIQIIEVIPEDILKKISEAQKKNSEFPFFATVYKIKAETNETTLVSDELMAAIARDVVDSYKYYFGQRYGIEPLVKIEFPEKFIESNEFYDILNVFHVYSTKLIAVLDEKIKRAGYFKSKTSGYSYLDIKNEVELLQDTQIKPLQAIVTNTKMTREMDASISVNQNKIKSLESLKQKKEMEADVSRKLLRDMLNDVQGGISRANGASASMSPEIKLDSALYDEMKKNDYKSFLLKSIIDAEVAAINSTVDIEFLKKDMEEIQKNKQTSGKIENMESKMVKVKDHLIAYARMVDEINSEYLSERIKNSITITRLPMVEMVRGKSLRLMLLLALCGSLFMAVFFAFLYEYIRNHADNTKQTVVDHHDYRDRRQKDTDIKHFKLKDHASL